MTISDNGVPVEFDSATIIDGYDLTFDPGDSLNGSLYVCTVRDSLAVDPSPMLTALRKADLWSTDDEKRVADDQRQAYKDGLEFVGAIAYRAESEHFVIARFDHPKFPSDSKRWQAWINFFDGGYERAE